MTQELDPAEYQRQYDEAAAKLDAAAEPATTALIEDKPAASTDETEQAAVVPVDPNDVIADLNKRIERAEKVAKDNQAWATKAAQEAANLRRQQEANDREASKPAILDANPELAEAIRYVASDPAPQQQADQQRAHFQSTIEKVHPDAFSVDMPEELLNAISTKWNALGDERQDPLEIIRVISEEKIAFSERQIGKRFAAESAKELKKSAMNVPSPGASTAAVMPLDAQLAEVQRIQNLSDADFQKERRKVLGYN